MAKDYQTSAWEIGNCWTCGSPAKAVPDNESAGWPAKKDFVAFCTNESCPNHEGTELYDQEMPDWLASDGGTN